MNRRIRLSALMLLIVLIALALGAYQSWNTRRYVIYVRGDANPLGKLTVSPGITVLDALNASGGLNVTVSDPDIRLIRAATAGAQAGQVLLVDLQAIIKAGDTTTNYRLKTGDRLVVYQAVRSPVINQALHASGPGKSPPAPR